MGMALGLGFSHVMLIDTEEGGWMVNGLARPHADHMSQRRAAA